MNNKCSDIILLKCLHWFMVRISGSSGLVGSFGPVGSFGSFGPVGSFGPFGSSVSY